jgi:DNA-binding transcriptional regulator YhcF (GntR family)
MAIFVLRGNMARFNPYKRYNGIYIPEGICKHKPLTPNSKLIYGRLMRYCGENGSCHPMQQTLADELGISLSSVQAALKLLVNTKLIEVERGNRMRNENDSYHFLESTILGTSKNYASEHVKPTSRQQVKVTPPHTQLSPIVHEDSHFKESQQRESSPLPQKTGTLSNEEEEVFLFLSKTLNLCKEPSRLVSIAKKLSSQTVKTIYLKTKEDIENKTVDGIGVLISRLENYKEPDPKDVQSKTTQTKRIEKTAIIQKKETDELGDRIWESDDEEKKAAFRDMIKAGSGAERDSK